MHAPRLDQKFDRMGLGLRLACALLLTQLVIAVPGPALASDGAEMKALFITQVAKFVEWPEGRFESEATPIRVGVLGQSSFYNTLRSELRGAQANGRGFELRYLDSIEKANEVHILVVTNDGRSNQRQMARALKGMPVLSIGNSFTFAESGGIFGLEIYDGKVAFEVNNRAAKKADLHISSRVLKLATTVY